MARINSFLLLSVAGSFLAGCATRTPVDIEELPPSAAGTATEHVVDNSDVAFYTTGEWATSQASPGYQGSNYSFSASGSGESIATWNLNIIKSFDIFAKWTTHPNRGSNVKFVIHYLNDQNNLVTDTVIVDQRENGGEWVKLGTYRMSALTGRVTVSDDADGYVIADAILFREAGATAPGETGDSDSDGIPDVWEVSFGLNPDDPSDASTDLDNDGLSNEDEYLFQTDPTNQDTDADGIPDGFEATFGLDPTIDDAGNDPDGDGISSYEEYLAETDPNDATSRPATSDILLTWQAPTERTDGTPLSEDEIAEYEIVYQRIVAANEVIVDNESPEFLSYGSGGFESSSTAGYVADNYFTMPAGSGEISAEWRVSNLTAGFDYELQANWTSHPNRGSNVQYRYTFINDSGSQTTETVTVDQRENGGSWQLLGAFNPADSVVSVSMNNNADGYVVADAIRVRTAPTEERSVTIQADKQNSYVVSGLPAGEWQFKIRAIDVGGLKSEFSDVKSEAVK